MSVKIKCKEFQHFNILKIQEIIFGFGRSGGNFNNWETPKRIGRLGSYEIILPCYFHQKIFKVGLSCLRTFLPN